MTTQTVKKVTAPKPKKKVADSRAVYKARNQRAPLFPSTSVIIKCRKILAKHYGKRLKGVILYGSMARKQSSAASDIDLLVLLTPPLDYFAELRQLVDVLYPIQLESEQLISAKPVSVVDFETGSISLYRNAKREGVIVQ